MLGIIFFNENLIEEKAFMKKILILALFTLLLSSILIAEEVIFTTPGGSFSLQINEANRLQGNRTDSGTVIDNIALKLEDLEKNYHSKLSRMDQTRANKIVEEIFAMLLLLPTDSNVSIERVSTSTDTTPESIDFNIRVDVSETTTTSQTMQATPTVERASQPDRRVMSNADFDRLISNVRAESFSDDQLRVIRISARNSYFSVDQITRMINVLTFSDDQLEALRIMYDKVVDPENGHNIINAFTYSSDKAEAERIISK